MSAQDVLELLLPDASPELLEHSRRVTTFVRLLSNDARGCGAGAVGVDLEQARREFDQEQTERLRGTVVDLLRHHLYAHMGHDGFGWLGEPRSEPQVLWSQLENGREEHPWLASVPSPGEAAFEVAERLFATLERLDPGYDRLPLWEAWLVRTREGVRAGEARFTELAEDGRQPEELRTLSRIAACEAMLDRGAVGEACVCIGQHSSEHPRLRQLLAWVHVLKGDFRAAREVQAGLAAWRGRLPAALGELRAHLREPGLIRGTCATDSPGEPSRAATLELSASRRSACAWRTELGAALFGAFQLTADGRARPLDVAVAAGLRDRYDAWLEQRREARAQLDELEHGVIVEARALERHRRDGVGLSCALDEGIRGLVIAPILHGPGDDAGEVAGWLRIECEHHLLPSPRRLEQAVRSWRDAVLGGSSVRALRPRVQRSGDAWIEAADADSAQARVFRALVDASGIKLSQRTWWGFEVRTGVPKAVARGGFEGGECGAGKVLTRALRCAGPVLFEDPNADLSLLRRSASGLVLPLVCEGVVCGLWAVESSRRRDFGAADSKRLSARIDGFAARLRAAQFREWHERRFAAEIHQPDPETDAHAWVRDLAAAARSSGPVVLCGPAGVGKRFASRRIHFESGQRSHPWAAIRCARWAESGAGEPEWLQPAGEGSRVLLELDRLPRELQSSLLHALEEHGSAEVGPRWIATMRSSVADAVQSGRIARELGQHLQRMQLFIPPLAARREELPDWILLFANRFARQEGKRTPSFSDESIALLWRQPWESNLPQLEDLIFKLVLFVPDGLLGAREVEMVCERFRIPLLKRLPSRSPNPGDLRAALRTTRTLRGTLNKTRASTYLGWDPDTLVSRMREAGIPLDLRFGSSADISGSR